MPRIVFIVQEKGGVGKSLVARALAEAVPDAPLIEIDSTRRLVELEDRTRFYRMRAERADIERTGGRAARAEFDPVIDALAAATTPTIVDVGANTSRSLLGALVDLKDDLAAAGVEPAVLVVTTAEPGALAEAPRLLDLASELGAERFLVENRYRGAVSEAVVRKLAKDVIVSVLDEHAMEEQAVALLQGGGLASIGALDPAKLTAEYGLGLGARIRRDLERLRLDAMTAVRPAAEWLVGSGPDDG